MDCWGRRAGIRGQVSDSLDEVFESACTSVEEILDNGKATLGGGHGRPTARRGPAPATRISDSAIRLKVVPTAMGLTSPLAPLNSGVTLTKFMSSMGFFG